MVKKRAIVQTAARRWIRRNNMIKRSLTAIIGLPCVLLILIFGNKYIIDCVVAVLAVCGIYEYMKCVSHKFKPVGWLGFVFAAAIAFLHVVPTEYIKEFFPLGIIGIVAILFMHVVFSDMKIDYADIAVTLFGILYIVGFFTYVAAIYFWLLGGVIFLLI